LFDMHHTPASGFPPILQVYFEAKVTDEGLCRVGWATRAAGLELGTDRQGFGFGGTGKKSFGKSFEDYGQKFGALLKVASVSMQCVHVMSDFAGCACQTIKVTRAQANWSTASAAAACAGLNDVIGCLLDTSAGTIAFAKNGADLGPAFEVPAALRG
jgi:ATP-dependent RNA helicase DDX1